MRKTLSISPNSLEWLALVYFTCPYVWMDGKKKNIIMMYFFIVWFARKREQKMGEMLTCKNKNLILAPSPRNTTVFS